MKEDAADRERQPLASLAQGGPAAFAAVVREHQGMVFSLALHFLKEPSLAEDLAQEVFLQLYQNRLMIKSADHLRFWLRKITCHRALDYARRRARHGALSLEDVPEPAGADAEEDPLLRDRLWRLVRSLPDKQRMVLILRYQEDLSLKEIADTMNIPVNTVKSSMERSLALLREKLARSTEGVRT